ncbi:amidophosphoribosyltransferase [Parabacteroides sp. PFB2-10]|uniref:amidophosphoribosyltransferase n=1 Tax=Parabacteroides sp. PFB2-10 TaxID=1742405 RepID=UPI002473ACEB|nr:amidophosphoribosyltransferase [Parabacteroides sp. PFB2-10]MDH6313393.1 amidophosphoribosyltransferase [Parabacteroides sp. PFB2-10]MDL2244861.1 amidophosphoribosyltransferase [Parabacteroides sp. OttesenSCG-928-J18]
MGGFFGTISKSACATDLFYGTDYNSHLGTRRGGMATLHEGIFRRSIHNLENSYFRTRFEADLDKFKGNSGIGIISDTDPQPIFVNSHLGKFAIVTVARVNNLDELEKELLDKGAHFTELSSGQTNQTELIALLVSQGKSFTEGIEIVQKKIKGSCSMLILTEHGLIAVRDKYGRTPVLIGRKEGAYAASSEPCSFPNLNFELEYNVGPGEAVLLTADSMTQLRAPNKKMQVCSFLWVYYGYPVSDYEGINVDAARYASGMAMAKKDDVEADYVAAIPDSGIGMGLGYAEGKGIPYRRAIIKYTPTWPRSFTPANQSVRDLVAKMKLIPNRELLRNKRVIFCDDSIVRGTQLRDNVNILYGYGAKEVHMRLGCPPILHSCPFLGFTASKSSMELIARRIIQELEGDASKDLDKYATTGSEQYHTMIDCIRRKLNITTLKFNTIEDLIASIGLPRECVCTHCYDGSSYF